MQKIQDLTMQNYTQNMEYFEKHHEKLHNKLLALETILGNGSIEQKYDLEFKDNYFDIVELKTNELLYNQNSYEHAETILNTVTLRKDDQVFETQRKYNFDKDVIDFIKKDDIYNFFSSTGEIIHYHHTHIDKSVEMIYIDKYIFFGVGLGLHVDKIINKFDLQVVLIIEDELELFRLSLFTTNYKDLSQKRDMFFSINENNQEFYSTFHYYYMKAFTKNHYLKFTLFSSLYEEKIQKIQSLLVTRPDATYSHNRLLRKNQKVIDKIDNNYKFLNTKKKDDKFFKDMPFLVLAAGPSLQNNEEWIKKHHNEFITIAAFASLKTLKRIGINPDIVAQIDENESTSRGMLKNLGDLSFLDTSIFMFSASIPDIVFEQFNKENIYLHEDRTRYKNGTSSIGVASVGETIYSIALIFNTPKIYLLGLDLALGEDGSSHSSDHFKSIKVEKKDKKDYGANNDFHLGKEIIQVKGNFKVSVNTTPLLAMSIPVVNYKTKQYKGEGQTVYNMSEGSFFNNMITLRTKDYKTGSIINKFTLFNNLKTHFDSYSSTELNDGEKDALELRMKYIDEFYTLMEAYKGKHYTTKDNFYLHYIKLIKVIFNSKHNNELVELIEIYLLKVTSFISDFYNTKNMKDFKRHNKKFRNSLIKQLNNLVGAYEKELLKITEEALEHSVEQH